MRLPVYESPFVPLNMVLVVPAATARAMNTPLRLRSTLGWRAEIRQIVRDGMADVLAWLGENAPRPLPDSEVSLRWEVLAEQRIGMQVLRPKCVLNVEV